MDAVFCCVTPGILGFVPLAVADTFARVAPRPLWPGPTPPHKTGTGNMEYFCPRTGRTTIPSTSNHCAFACSIKHLPMDGANEHHLLWMTLQLNRGWTDIFCHSNATTARLRSTHKKQNTAQNWIAPFHHDVIIYNGSWMEQPSRLALWPSLCGCVLACV